MKNIVIVLRNLKTKEFIGAIQSIEPIDIFYSMLMGSCVMDSWEKYYSNNTKLDINDYIEFHNSHYPIKIKETKMTIIKTEISLN